MTNDEWRNKSEARMSKTLNCAVAGFVIRISSFVIRILRIAVCSIKRPVSGLMRAAGVGSVHGKGEPDLHLHRSCALRDSKTGDESTPPTARFNFNRDRHFRFVALQFELQFISRFGFSDETPEGRVIFDLIA